MVNYRSAFEKKVAASLEKLGVKFTYEALSLEYDVRLPRSCYCMNCRSGGAIMQTRLYLVDFTFPKKGKMVIIESKGRFTASDRKKMLSIIKRYGDRYDIKLLFQRDNYLTKKHGQRYSQWCEKNGVDYSISPSGDVPKDWIK